MQEISGSEKSRSKVFYDLDSRPHPLAVKVVECKDDFELKKTLMEAELGKECRGPNICEISFYEEEQREDNCYYAFIIMRYYPRNLETDIRERNTSKSPYPEDIVWNYLKTLVKVFKFMQEKGISHRNIKPTNILLDEEKNAEGCVERDETGYPKYNLKVCDFASAKKVDPKALNTLLGTLMYFSPLLRRALIEGTNVSQKRVQHNTFKTDVYSLGIMMLYLMLLELPIDITQLKNLQQIIEKHIASTAGVYSERLRRVLSCMLTVEEEGRPDFLELSEIIDGNGRSYADDQWIPAVVVENVDDPLEASIHCILPYIRVGSVESEEAMCLLSLFSKKQEEISRNSSADFVCIIDVSGSMEGERLDYVRSALSDLIDKLSDRDRMTIITFSDQAKRICPLLTCTAIGKQDLKRCLDTTTIGDLTNLAAGYKLGLEILRQRRYKNFLASILLFTDGLQTVEDPQVVEDCAEARRYLGIDNLSVWYFDLGEQQDAGPIDELAFSDDLHKIKLFPGLQNPFNELFGTFLQTRIVAKDIHVTFQNPPNSLVPCRAVDINSLNAPDFTLAQIFVNSKHHFVFKIIPPKTALSQEIKHRVLSAEMQYIDMDGCPVRNQLHLDIKCKNWASVKAIPNSEEFMDIFRERVMNCTHEVMQHRDNHRLEEAKQSLSNCLVELRASGLDMKKVIELLEAAKAEIEGTLQTGSQPLLTLLEIRIITAFQSK